MSHPPIDLDRLRANAPFVDPALLLMVLVEVSGETGYLDEFEPLLNHPPKPKVRGRIPVAELKDEDLERLVDLLCKAIEAGPVEDRPSADGETMVRMLSVATGYEVPSEYAGPMQDQSGLQPPPAIQPRDAGVPEGFSVTVLGAGMTGLAAGVRLGREGIPYTILERSDEVGGVWNINTFPGAAVDTPSVYYSLSYKLQDWSRFYPTGAEYHDYLKELADELGVREHVQFRTEVSGMTWHEDRRQWEVRYTVDGQERSHFSNAVITALGYLNDPKFPNVPGQDTFAGDSWHTAQWNHDVDLSDKRIAMIGTGATAVQVADALAGKVKEFTLFQRQPTWILPDLVGKADVPAEERWMVANVPYFNQMQRAKTFWYTSDVVQYPRIFVDREWYESHDGRSISESNAATLDLCLEHIRENFGEDTPLARAVTPDFPPNAKRNVRDPGGFYPAIAKGLITLEDTAITEIVPEGVKLADGRVVEVDVIIYATGYHLRYLSHLDIVGRDGVSLNEHWGDNPRAYLGGTVPGFPNLFITSAPNGAPNHGGSHNFITETAVQYIVECLWMLFNAGASEVEARPEVLEEYCARIDRDLEDTVWGLDTTAHTYYRNSTGRMTLPNPWKLVDNWHMQSTPEPEAFVLR